MAACRIRRLFILYIIITCFAFLWFCVKYGFNCNEADEKQYLPSDPDDLQRKLEQREQEMREKEQVLTKVEENLLRMEKELRMRYPMKAASIFNQNPSKIPTIYAITPTYTRPVQKAELVRLSQTFLHVRNFHWIVVEDNESKTKLVTRFLSNTGLQYTHLNVLTPPEYKMKSSDPDWLKPRGTLQRNLALQWIRKNVDPISTKGVVYFADDDNTYDLQLFEEMRDTTKVSVWPVGLVGGLRYERPQVEHNKVVGWYAFWKPQRPFAMDMAGFAFNAQLLFDHPNAKFEVTVRRGYQETSLLQHLAKMDDLEPKADFCSKVYVWHTRTEKPKLKNEAKLVAQGRNSDPTVEV